MATFVRSNSMANGNNKKKSRKKLFIFSGIGLVVVVLVLVIVLGGKKENIIKRERLFDDFIFNDRVFIHKKPRKIVRG